MFRRVCQHERFAQMFSLFFVVCFVHSIVFRGKFYIVSASVMKPSIFYSFLRLFEKKSLYFVFHLILVAEILMSQDVNLSVFHV